MTFRPYLKRESPKPNKWSVEWTLDLLSRNFGKIFFGIAGFIVLVLLAVIGVIIATIIAVV